MSVTIPAFWQLLTDSRLLAREQCDALAADFAQVKGAGDRASARTLAEWLISRNILSKYQATILLAGRAGPFQYGQYKVYDRVDKGRLAGLFRAVHGPTGHPVLLSFVSGAALADPNQWAAAAASAWAAAAVVSPHVQRWFEPVDAVIYKFVVSEDLRGTTAEERMTGSRFPPAEASRIARQAALGLGQLHAAGRVHGEVRPANFLLEPIPGQPANTKLLWNAYEAAGPWNFAEDPPGARLAAAADFLAPELATPGCRPDALADLYALGCSLYTMLAGSPPFAGGTVAEKMARHATEPIRPLEQFGVPQPLAQLVAYLMAKNPAVRYQAATLVADQLAVFIEPAALYAQPAPPAPPTLAPYEAHLRQTMPPTPAPPPTAPPPMPAQPGISAAQPDLPTGFPVLTGRKVAFAVDTFGPTMPEASSTVPALSRPAFPGFPASDSPAASQTFIPAGPPPPPGTPLPPPAPAAAPQPLFPSVATATGEPTATKAPAIAPINATAALAQRAARRQRQQLVTAAGVVAACIAVVVVSVVLLMNSELFQEPGGTAVAEADPNGGKAAEVEKGDGGQGAPVTQASTGAGAKGIANPPAGQGAAPAANPPQPVTTPVAPAGDGSFQQEVVPDDSRLLWASPTTGRPISERLIPPEPQVFVFVRPADMIAGGEGEKVLQALGPAFAAQRSAWEKAAGVGLAEIEQLMVTLHANGAKFPRASFVVRTKTELPPDQWLTRWNNPIPMQEGMATYYQMGGWAYYISPSPDDPRTFVMGDPQDVKEVVKAGGNPPPLGVPIRRLLKTTDSLRHVTILAIPQFFANDDGEPLFAAERAKLRQPLAWLIGDGVQAAAVSLHFGSELYFETRMLGTLDKEPFLLSSEVKSRLSQVPDEIENYLVSLTPPPYWKKLSFRYPAMLRELHDQLRIGVENDQAVINAVLPGVAAHNLVLGGELLVSTGAGGGSAVATIPAATKSQPKTLAEALELKTTFAFAQQSLEFAMRDLAVDASDQLKGSGVEFAIKIIGGDLEKDGITRNQSIRDFDEKDKSIGEILTALVRKANPDPSAKGPDDPAQKLVWVIGPDPDDASKQMILITTRAAAAANKYTLPPVFAVKDDGKKKGK